MNSYTHTYVDTQLFKVCACVHVGVTAQGKPLLEASASRCPHPCAALDFPWGSALPPGLRVLCLDGLLQLKDTARDRASSNGL